MRGIWQPGRGGTSVRAIALAIALAVAALVSSAGSAEARCVTVGIDSISHTQCDLP